MAKKKVEKVDKRKKYDWREISKKYVNGVFDSVQEFQRYVKKRKELYPEEKWPSNDAIWKASTKFQWAKLKAKRGQKIIEKLADGAIDEGTKRALEDHLNSKTMVNKALLKILIHWANHPEQLTMKANLGDIVNDLKRGLGMTTKEQQTGMGYSAPGLIKDDDSFRKQLEEMKSSDITTLDDMNELEMKELESAIPVEDLSFIDEDNE